MRKLLASVLSLSCFMSASAQNYSSVMDLSPMMDNWSRSSIYRESQAKINTDEEHYISIGYGMYQDPFHTLVVNSTGEILIPSKWEVEIEESIENPGKYRIYPYKSSDARQYFNNSDFTEYDVPIIIHASDMNRVYFEPFKTYDRTYYCFVPELGFVSESGNYIYGKFSNGIITINREGGMGSMSSDSDDIYYVNNDSRNFELTMPEGYQPTQLTSGLYFGITAFSYAPDIMGMSILTKDNKNEFKDFVNNMEKGNATYLYYSTEVAIGILANGIFPADLSHVVLITFTDGCDDGSLEMADKSWTDADYQRHLASLLSTTKVYGLPIDAYSIGLKGNDIGESNYPIFKENLRILASEDNQATEVSDMSDVQTTLDAIIDGLQNSWINYKVTCRINTRATGDVIRFTLDKSREMLNNNPEKSELWIEGTFSRVDDSLNDVIYHGLSSSSGSHVPATKITTDKGTKYSFTFEDLVDENGNPIEIGEIAYWHKRAGDNIWNPHTEFTQGADAAVETEYKSAAIMFVMDCSDSLGDDYPSLQLIVNNLIDRLVSGDENSIISPWADEHFNNGPIEYFNLQGIRVTAPSNGIYIRRQGNNTVKVMIR